MGRLSGRVAVVTGASSGVGGAISLRLALEDAVVWMVARRRDRLEAAAAKVPSSAPAPTIYTVDLTVDEDTRGLVAQLEKACGRVDILVHSAGVYARGAISFAQVDNLDTQYRVNVRAPYLLTSLLLPQILPCQGQIVFMNSSAGLQARAGVAHYAATKHALKAIADALREEVNHEGVRVVSVFLGRTATPMQAMIHDQEGKPYSPGRLIQPEDVATLVVDTLSLPRSVEVTDLNLRPLLK